MTRMLPKRTTSGGITGNRVCHHPQTQLWSGFKPGFAGGKADAENRLISVTVKATGHRSEFGYDGLGRRVEIIEKDLTNGTLTLTSDKKYLWDGVEIAEERSADGATVTKHFYTQGFADNDGTNLYYTRDHLGSIRELVDAQQVVRARYDYDPYGRMTKIQGDRDSFFGYTGMPWHQASGLNFAMYRAYDPNLGRWINRDPIGEAGGINLYRYVGNDPINRTDLTGLACQDTAEAVSACILAAVQELNAALDQAQKVWKWAVTTYTVGSALASSAYGTALWGCSLKFGPIIAVNPMIGGIGLAACAAAASAAYFWALESLKKSYEAAERDYWAKTTAAWKKYDEDMKNCKLCEKCPAK